MISKKEKELIQQAISELSVMIKLDDSVYMSAIPNDKFSVLEGVVYGIAFSAYERGKEDATEEHSAINLNSN